MIERLMAWSLRNRPAVVFLVAVTVAAGVWAVRTIPIDAFPDVTNIQVEVVSAAPGLSPLEIEQFVTYPIESSMRGLPGLALMRSITKYGISVVTLVFDDDVDIYFARQLVFERLAEAERRVPAGVETTMGPVATAMGEIYQYTLEPEARTAPPGHGGRPRPAAHAAGLGGDAASQERARRDGGELLRGVPAGVPGGRRPGPSAQVRPAPRNGARAHPGQQLERRRQHRVAAVRAVHHSRRRPDPVGGRHQEDRPEVGGRHAGVRRRPGRGAHGPRRPPGRGREGRHPRGGRRHRHDAARREQPRRSSAGSSRRCARSTRAGCCRTAWCCSPSTSGRRWSRPARGPCSSRWARARFWCWSCSRCFSGACAAPSS